MTDAAQTPTGTEAEDVHKPVIVAGPTPSPEIAPGADVDVPDAQAAESDAGRWLRFDGPAAQTVVHVGEWAPGQVRHVAGWLADRLLPHPLFTEADAPERDDAGDAPAAPSAPTGGPLPADLTTKTQTRKARTPSADISDTDAA